MISPKSRDEIFLMKEGGKRLRAIFEKLKSEVKPGVSTIYLNNIAEELMKKLSVFPSFKTVKGYRFGICTPVNEQIVHTPPSRRVLKNGDLLTIDIGVFYKGYHTDFAYTMVVGETYDRKLNFFLSVGEKALENAILKAREGNYLGEISLAIEKTIEEAGFSVIKELTGHGIGQKLHEDPFIPGYLNKPLEHTIRLEEGLTLAVEVIYSKGKSEITYEKNSNWSIVTQDKSLSACFEKTIVVGKNKALILT